mgnify:CR=1 FL=1
MRKKAVQQGRSEVRDAKKNERHVCGRARVGERPVSLGRIVLLRCGEPLRFTPRGITRGTLVNAAEPVRRPCLARTPLADFFRILYVVCELWLEFGGLAVCANHEGISLTRMIHDGSS